jgi:hypothetical protein
MIGRPWRLARSGRRLGEKAWWRGVIEGLGRLDKTRPHPGEGMGRQRSARPDKRWSGPGRFSSGPHREPLGDDRPAGTPVRIAAQLGVADVRFDAFHELGRHVPNAMFLRMLGRFREDLLFRLAAHHVLTPARWIDLGAFQDFGHGHISPLSGVAMSQQDTGVVETTLC